MTENENILKYQKERTKKNLGPLLSRTVHFVGGQPKSDKNGEGIRVMQWNMLAQALTMSTRGDNFILCPPDALSWDNRKLHVMEELLTYNPTVVCLQEVDQFTFIQNELAELGYTGTFLPKPSSPCLDFKGNFGPDGCAIFWKSDLIEVMDVSNNVIEVNEYDTNQVCLVAHMKTKGAASNQEFVVAATHLKAKSGYEKLRERQSQYIVQLLGRYKDIPLVLCGDFNAEPSENAYKEIVSSKLNLASAYTYLSETRDEPDFTTIKVRGSPKGAVSFCRTIDYIFFSKKKLVPISIVKFPTKEEIGEKMLPSYNYPSDHLSLVCDLKFLE